MTLGVSQLFNNGFLCTRPCYLQGSRTGCRTLSRNSRTGCRAGSTRRHVGLILSLHYHNLQNLLFWRANSVSPSKFSSPAWEEISEAEVDAGLDSIHALNLGKAADQCCLPRWQDLALASIRDRLSFPHCLRVQPSQIVHGFSGFKPHSPAAIRHCGHEA